MRIFNFKSECFREQKKTRVICQLNENAFFNVLLHNIIKIFSILKYGIWKKRKLCKGKIHQSRFYSLDTLYQVDENRTAALYIITAVRKSWKMTLFNCMAKFKFQDFKYSIADLNRKKLVSFNGQFEWGPFYSRFHLKSKIWNFCEFKIKVFI